MNSYLISNFKFCELCMYFLEAIKGHTNNSTHKNLHISQKKKKKLLDMYVIIWIDLNSTCFVIVFNLRTHVIFFLIFVKKLLKIKFLKNHGNFSKKEEEMPRKGAKQNHKTRSDGKTWKINFC